MTERENIIIKNIGKKPILADVSFCDSFKNKPVVIFCHGYKGFKDWGAWNLVADYFAKEDFVFLKFNFSHNGSTIDNPIDFPDEQSFGNNTYSIELEDLGRVITFVEQEYPSSPIYLIGHSRGGGIATLKTGQDARISKLVTWAAVSDFKSRFPIGKELDDWKSEGVTHVLNGRTKQHLPHYYSFYEDFIQNESKLDIGFWCNKIKAPHLIIHGKEDKAVSIKEGEKLHNLNPNSSTYFLETNHTFETKHPWEKDKMSTELENIISVTVSFCRGC